MKKTAYTKPEIEITVCLPEGLLEESRWGVNGEGGTIKDGENGEGEDPFEITSKDGSNMWDGWED